MVHMDISKLVEEYEQDHHRKLENYFIKIAAKDRR